MICPECNKEISDSAVFCPACGTQLASEVNKKDADETTQAASVATSANSVKDKRLTCPTCGSTSVTHLKTGTGVAGAKRIVLGAIVFVGVFLFALLNGLVSLEPLSLLVTAFFAGGAASIASELVKTRQRWLCTKCGREFERRLDVSGE